MIDLPEFPCPGDAIETSFLDGEAVVYDTVRAQSWLLNSAASVVWLLVDGQTSLSDMVDTIVDSFGLERDAVAADVNQAVQRFGELGLLAGVTPLETPEGHVAVGGALAPPPVP
jgi:hypothetical protein